MRSFSSIFSQLLKLFPRLEFEQVARMHGAERHARGFTCWQQLVSMLFCHLGRAQSLREICNGVASAEGKLSHLGISAPSRSTLAYANQHRPWTFYRDLFVRLRDRCRMHAPKHRFRFNGRLLSLDSTVIDLCVTVFDWAKFRRTKGAVKLHLLLDHDGYLPYFGIVTDGKKHDIRVARRMPIPPGSVVVFDRGYLDFGWFEELTDAGTFFVTRLKANTRYQVFEDRSIPANRGILRDQIIQLVADQQRPYPFFYRRIEVLDQDHDRTLVLLTNHLEFGASTISALYRDRWQIESFFKAIKQNLRIKTFVGTSSNALQIQLWTALIAILILKYLQFQARWGWSLSNLVALLRFNLFSHRDLWSWLHDPFSSPDRASPGPVQLSFFQYLGQQA